jgi:hypothetical protein
MAQESTIPGNEQEPAQENDPKQVQIDHVLCV